MPEKPAGQDLAHGVPPIAVSSTSTLANRTGSWKYIQPIYQDRVAPCNAACPVGVDIEGCMDLLRRGKLDEARDLMLRENPLPAVTGRVCEHPCHTACSRGAFDEPVNIRAVERMLGERDLGARTNAARPKGDAATPVPAAASRPRRKEKVAVVGSGPAGLACAYHLARLGYAVNVFESDPEPGGRLRYGIPDHKLPRAVLAREIDRIRAAGVTFRCDARLGKNLAWETIERHDAIFIATGAREHEPRDWERHDLPAVRSGLDFLREVRAGEPKAVGQRVVVIGGTDEAVDCARTALRLGSEVVLLFHGAREEMEADAEAVAAACREGLRLECLARPVGLQLAGHASDEQPLEAIESMFEAGEGGLPSTRLVGVACVRVRPPAAGEGGAPGRLTVPGSAFVISADTVLTAAGAEPGCDFLPPDLHRRGFTIRCDEWGRTSKAGLFAGGDVAGEPRTVAHALGAGKRVAIGIDHWLRQRAGESLPEPDPKSLRYGANGNVSITRWRGDDPVPRVNELNEVVPREMLNFAYFTHEPSRHDRWSAPGFGTSALAEVNLGLPPADALAEAKRCLNCGVCNDCDVCMIVCPDVAIHRHAEHGFSLSYKYCKGCGLCVTECPRGAMTMTREGL